MSQQLTNRQLMSKGMADTLPMMIGAAPFGLIFGALALNTGLNVYTTIAMSVFVFAGSSQFIALTLLASGTALPIIWMTTFVVNLRHALYSATLLPYARTWPGYWRSILSFWLTDETFAVVEHRFRTNGAEQGMWYQLGSSLAMYINWLIWTIAGVVIGQSVPQLGQWGLDFAMVATFAAIVAPQWVKRPVLVAACAAGSTAMLARGLPYKLDLMLAAAIGVLAGVVAESLMTKKNKSQPAILG